VNTSSQSGRTGRAVLLDDRSRPGARAALGGLLARSASADIAVDRVRLAAIDFRDRDLAGLRQCRVVLGNLDVHALIDAAEAAARAPAIAANVAVLRRFIATGRLQLRSGGARRWRPDFCVLHGDGLRPVARSGAISFIGHLGIGAAADRGPNLTCVLAGEDATRRAGDAFDRLWSDGHDVLDVVAETLDRYASP
jgi:hypothetical protein